MTASKGKSLQTELRHSQRTTDLWLLMGETHQLKGTWLLISSEMRWDFSAPEVLSHSAIGYKRMIQYLVIAVAGEFPSLGKENGFQGFLSLSGLLDLCLRVEVSKFPLPSITAAKMFPNLQLMEIVLILQPGISCFWISLPLLWFMCMADSVHLSFPQRGKRSSDDHSEHINSLSFTNTCSHFCSWSCQPQGRPRARLLTPQSPWRGAVPGWHPKQTVWLQSWTFIHRLVGGSAGWGAERFPPMQRQYQPVTHN